MQIAYSKGQVLKVNVGEKQKSHTILVWLFMYFVSEY